MPYKVFVAGEEALAADANAYLMSQTVPRFTNATQRTSQLTAPVLGQLSMLDTRPGAIQYWTGSAWADGLPMVQGSVTTVTTDAQGLATITFPVAFAAGSPAVTCNIAGPSNTAVPFTAMVISNPLNTAFAAKVWAGNTPHASAAISLQWIAVGARA